MFSFEDFIFVSNDNDNDITLLCVGFIVNGVVNVIVSTLERRFKLRSTQMGWVVSAYDLSAAVLGIFIRYKSTHLGIVDPPYSKTYKSLVVIELLF